MNAKDDLTFLRSLVSELRKLPAEIQWVEFKENNANPQDVGEYLSALSNAAAMARKANAYLVWGIKDGTHEVVGTTFEPAKAKGKGNEDLENWLVRKLSPRLHFRFHSFDYEGHSVVVLEVPRSHTKPTQFDGIEYIRVGSYRKKLTEYPDQEKELWRILDETPFESRIAKEHVEAGGVLKLINYPSYFKLLDRELPENRDAIMEALESDSMVVRNDAGSWGITNLGAVLLANSLDDFEKLTRKSLRVIEYEGRNRIKTIKEQLGQKGYASGFEGLVQYVNERLPRNEVIEQALRKEVPMYPELAVRELIANALIHQDFFVVGAGPMIEIFSDRMEITNPGLPLVSTERFLDAPPRSRNEALASFLRRVGVCEERGSGVDKVVFETEFYQLPAPSFETPEDSTRAVLFAHKQLNEMDKKEKVRACYLHSALRYVQREPMTNSSLRERFGIEDKNMSLASRIIKDALEANAIKPFDENQSRKYAKYVPYWA